MNIKKIVFKFKSGYITPLESDTILSYVFANDFENLQDIYEDFKKENIPFLISNAFDKGYIIRPYYIADDRRKDKDDLLEDIKDEADRKKIKKLSILPITKAKEILELQFNNNKSENEQERYDELLKQIINDTEEKNKKENNNSKNNNSKNNIKNITIAEFKNSIPRFNSSDTNPFTITVNYSNIEKVIYVKIFDEEKYNRFLNSFKNIFKTIGYGAGKSRGYGKVEYIKEEELNKDEKDFFDYVEKLKGEKKYIVLNNYKPSDTDLKNIDTKESFILINHKHTKALDNMPFKGKMSFISAGSVVVGENLKGTYYKTQLENKESTNFGYLF